MREPQTRAVLTALLDESGAVWTTQTGWIGFRLEREGRLWEMRCLPVDEAVLCYGRYPFRVENRAEGLRRCDEVNRKAVRGAMFLPDDGRPVFRTRAELDDAYGARQRLKAAIEYNAAILARFWNAMSRGDPMARFRNPADADSFPFQITAAPPYGGDGESV
ncbi:MAG: hypothetical protein IKN96_09145 [Oscillibacter sp.]|nr:hypothetical protein [Oscillibacter sp.]